MARRSIPAETKAAILAEASVEGAKLPEIATKYQVSLPSIYNWKKTAKVVEAAPEAPLA